MHFLLPACALLLSAASGEVRFSPSASTVERYDVFEVEARVTPPPPGNPFTDTGLRGEFRAPSGETIAIDGFCDSPDGGVYLVRFMPSREGKHTYRLAFQSRSGDSEFEGSFTAVASRRKGPVRIDPEHPWHFLWEGTKEHFFWNGTTAYALAGWDEATIRASIDRLRRLKVNRIRAAINPPRVENGRAWFEPVYPTKNFTFLLNPWVAARPASVPDPGYDVSRFNVAMWQKYERLLRHARERDVIISVIFYVDGRQPGVDPFGKQKAGGEDEQRYYRYAAARLAAFSNVMWDVTNEWHLFRDAEWVEKMGTFLKAADPYDRPTSCHGRGDFPWMASPWADFAMYQIWDEHGGYKAMLDRRRKQAATGRPMPQINEEYGYEDHYPKGWGENRKPPARSADNRRRLAWEMCMAGCYQTTGERADRGTGWGPDTGGGWVNARGDDTMTMLAGYGHIVDFFRSFSYWKLEPVPEIVQGNALCLAETGKRYVVYLPDGGTAQLKLTAGTYRARLYNPRGGQWRSASTVTVPDGQLWTTPRVPEDGDWVLLLERQ